MDILFRIQWKDTRYFFLVMELFLLELLKLGATLLPMVLVTLAACSCNDRNREQMHLQRRQALKKRQREAVIEGRSVRSVIETEVEPVRTPCFGLTCVRMMPQVKKTPSPSHHNGGDDYYSRLSASDEKSKRLEKSKPPPAEKGAVIDASSGESENVQQPSSSLLSNSNKSSD
ncbi:unnamed protein product [Caenorhabditis auriculariae]|uniref:Uncharacterized protein n=1 Tax=Caenorhabditis auriculariae TaxID=2777116 RepID=A0A8S1HEL2_9PELO|nr:unnamed protein product [Caenorhabditis auriculariae]